MLLESYRRPQASRPTPEERAAAIEAAKPVPKWRQDWEEKRRIQREAERERLKAEIHSKQPSPDRGAYLLGRAYRDSADRNPIPGFNSWSFTLDEGFLADGTKVRRHKAYVQVLWDMHEFYNPDGVKRPACLLPQGELKPETVDLDGYKKLQADIADKERQDKITKRLNRGRRGR